MSSLCVKFQPSSTPPSDRFWWGVLLVLVLLVLLVVTGVKQSQLWGLRLSLEFDKSYVLLKVVKAKLPGTLEGGGVGVKHKQTNNFFDKGAHFYHNRPWGIGLTSISNVKRVVYTQFPNMCTKKNLLRSKDYGLKTKDSSNFRRLPGPIGTSDLGWRLLQN